MGKTTLSTVTFLIIK